MAETAIRIYVLGRRKDRFSWKVFPPKVFKKENVEEELPESIKRSWVKKRNAFYIRSEQELIETIKYLSNMLVKMRKEKK